MRRRSLAWKAALATLLSFVVHPASAGAILDRVKHDGLLHCAAAERPGYAAIEGGVPTGRAADVCRAVAERILGRTGGFALRLLDLDSDFDRVRNGEIELAFLEPRIVTEQKLGPLLLPIAEAYRDSFAVMVPEGASMRSLADLSGQTTCFMIGDPVWPLLQDGLKSRGVSFRPFGFSEEVEMKDAYNVGRCGAMAGVASVLDELRADGGINHLTSRLLEERLGPDPVLALVPAGDSEWATTVRAGMDALPAP